MPAFSFPYVKDGKTTILEVPYTEESLVAIPQLFAVFEIVPKRHIERLKATAGAVTVKVQTPQGLRDRLCVPVLNIQQYLDSINPEKVGDKAVLSHFQQNFVATALNAINREQQPAHLLQSAPEPIFIDHPLDGADFLRKDMAQLFGEREQRLLVTMLDIDHSMKFIIPVKSASSPFASKKYDAQGNLIQPKSLLTLTMGDVQKEYKKGTLLDLAGQATAGPIRFVPIGFSKQEDLEQQMTYTDFTADGLYSVTYLATPEQHTRYVKLQAQYRVMAENGGIEEAEFRKDIHTVLHETLGITILARRPASWLRGAYPEGMGPLRPKFREPKVPVTKLFEPEIIEQASPKTPKVKNDPRPPITGTSARVAA